VAIGGFFSAESMFHRVTDASKVAIVGLVDRLRAGGFELIDIQFLTAHTARLGGIEIPKTEYLRRLTAALNVRGRRRPR
jgi:leucyl/phenylalanyl-tRNA--protein transferase